MHHLVFAINFQIHVVSLISRVMIHFLMHFVESSLTSSTLSASVTPRLFHSRLITYFLPAIRWYGRELRLLFLCPVTDISATVAPIGVKFCTMVHIGPGQILSLFGGDAPGIRTSEILGLNFVHLTANISKTVSRSVT